MEVKRGVFKLVLSMTLFVMWSVVHAATYTFPGNLPPGCSGTSGTYSCSGLSLNYQDTIVIASPKPATITVNGNFSTNQNQINTSGTAADLTLIVTGTLNLNWNSRLNANVIAGKINGDSAVIFGGNIRSTDDITIGPGAQISGTVTCTAGQVQLGSSATVGGAVTAAKDVTVNYQTQISGAVTSTTGQVKLESEIVINGSLTAAKDLSIGHKTQIAGAVTSSTGQVKMESESIVESIRTMTDGDVTIDYQGVVCGNVVTQSGDIKLATEIRIGGNLASTSGDITIGWHSYVRDTATTSGSIQNNGGGVNQAGLSLPAFCAALPGGGGTPSGFNAFDTSTAANAVSGYIKTKIAGEPFNVALVALTATPSVKTDFIGTVSAQLVDGSGSTDCANRTAIGLVSTVAFVASNQGRVNTTFTENNAWPNLMVRMTYTPSSGSSIVACSTDRFAIRPYVLAVSVTDGDWETAGTTRTLNNVATNGGVVHKAGRPFTMTATGYNKLGAITSNYAGMPVAVIIRSELPYKETCANCVLSGVAFASSGSAGTVVSTTSKYSEVGAFVMQLQDTQFASIDASDGSTLQERTLASELATVGRFIPDHFTLQDGSTVDPACTVGGFTYMDQPFARFAFALEARNADEGVTQHYADALVKSTVSIVAENGDDGINRQARLESLPAASWANGIYSVDTSAAYWRRRTATKDGSDAPDGAFDSLLFGIKTVDSEGVLLAGRNLNAATAGDCIAAGNCDSKRVGDSAGAAQPTKVRFGRLRLLNAYGSERLTLPIPTWAQYYNGSFFVANTLDRCTVISKNNIGLSNYTGGVSASNMTVDQNVSLGNAFVSGRGNFRLTPPNPIATKSGGVKICAALGSSTTALCSANTAANMPWLRGRWSAGSTTYTDDPVGHASFGVYKNSAGEGATIYLREMY